MEQIHYYLKVFMLTNHNLIFNFAVLFYVETFK